MIRKHFRYKQNWYSKIEGGMFELIHGHDKNFAERRNARMNKCYFLINCSQEA